MVSEEEIKKLVISRLQSMPDNLKLSIGSLGSFDRINLISHVEKGDEVGKKIVEMHLFYLKSFKKKVEEK